MDICLNTQQSSSDRIIYCPLCFRIYYCVLEEWVQHEVSTVIFFVQHKWVTPPYQQVIIECMQPYRDNYVSLCKHCSLFLRRNAESSNRCRHPMLTAMNFILSGGCTESPPSSLLIHCIDSLLYKFPLNPIYRGYDNELKYMVKSIQFYTGMFNVPIHDFTPYLCAIKWQWDGCPYIIKNNKLVKHLRRFFGVHPYLSSWYRQLPHSCRFCGPCTIQDELNCDISYSVRLNRGIQTKSHIMNMIVDGVERIERMDNPIEHVSVFCHVCCSISIISFTYVQAWKKLIGYPFEYGDPYAYYIRLIKKI